VWPPLCACRVHFIERSEVNMDPAEKKNPPPPEQVLMQMMMGRIISRALTLVAQLGIADHLSQGAVAVEKLAAQTGSNADALYRVLRTLSAVGVFAETEGRRFALTRVSEVLRSDAKPSFRNMACMLNEDWHWSAWGRLDHSVKTGKPA